MLTLRPHVDWLMAGLEAVCGHGAAVEAFARCCLLQRCLSMSMRHRESEACLNRLLRCMQAGDVGCYGHPTTLTHMNIAAIVQDYIANITSWDAVGTETSFLYNN